MSGQLYYNEMMGAGAALFDYDNDGDLDVFLVQGRALDPSSAPVPSDRLFRNDLAGGVVRFVDVTAAAGIVEDGYGMGVAAGDFDRDGFVDLYVTNHGANRHWRNRGDGRFEDVTDAASAIGRWSVPAAVLDFDRDGFLDLYVGNYVDYSVKLNKRCQDELGQPNYCGPLAFAPQPDTLLRNRGNGRFEDWSGRAGILSETSDALGALAADFDHDGWTDIYVANDGKPNFLWRNLGATTPGRFENVAVQAGAAVNGRGQAEASMGIAAADFDNDLDEDLIVTHLTRETNTVYRNEGGPGFIGRELFFTDVSAETGLGPPSMDKTAFGVGFFDYDNDGWLDVLTVNGAVRIIKELALKGDPLPLHQTNQLFRNVGAGRFVEATKAAGPAFALSEVSRGAAFGDLDNDGDTDVLITNNNGRARILINQVGQDRPWLGLRLIDEKKGSDLPGSAVTLTLGDGTKIFRRVIPTASYASSNDPRLLFGLGRDSGPASAVVDWPDGRRERFDNIAVGRYSTLKRSTGVALEVPR